MEKNVGGPGSSVSTESGSSSDAGTIRKAWKKPTLVEMDYNNTKNEMAAGDDGVYGS